MAEEIKLSKNFIETELPAAPPEYVKIYLMTLATSGTAAEVAQKLGVTETDVLYAWGYWKGKGYLKEEAPKPEIQEKMEQPRLLSSERPDYSPAELAVYMQRNEGVKNLFQSAQQKLGKMLNHSDMSLLLSFHDWLGLPMDVIELLLSYCSANGHAGMRYIEKVAIGWAEEGITTKEKAAEFIEMRKHGFRAILKAFGHNRLPVATEETYMKKWLQEYGMPLDVVTLACERTVLQTGKASFAYADKILENWKTSGVRAATDVEELDKAFAAKKAQPASPERNQTAPKKQNRFINYTQREWDFAELERLEREQRDKR